MLFYDTSEKPQDFFTVVKMWQKENKMKPVRLTLSEKHQYLGGFKASTGFFFSEPAGSTKPTLHWLKAK